MRKDRIEGSLPETTMQAMGLFLLIGNRWLLIGIRSLYIEGNSGSCATVNCKLATGDFTDKWGISCTQEVIGSTPIFSTDKIFNRTVWGKRNNELA